MTPLEQETTLDRSLFRVALQRSKLLHDADAVVDRAEGYGNQHGDNEAVEEVAERVTDQVGFLKWKVSPGEGSRTGKGGVGAGGCVSRPLAR
jgi:hypothetical protein